MTSWKRMKRCFLNHIYAPNCVATRHESILEIRNLLRDPDDLQPIGYIKNKNLRDDFRTSETLEDVWMNDSGTLANICEWNPHVTTFEPHWKWYLPTDFQNASRLWSATSCSFWTDPVTREEPTEEIYTRNISARRDLVTATFSTGSYAVESLIENLKNTPYPAESNWGAQSLTPGWWAIPTPSPCRNVHCARTHIWNTD